MGFLEWFRAGGWTMWLVLGTALSLLPVAIVHAAVAQRATLVAGAILLGVVLAAGAFGTLDGRRRTDEACATIAPDDAGQVARIRATGYQEASGPIHLAGVLAALGGVPLVVGEVRRRGRRRA